MTNELLEEALRHARICRTFGGGTKEHAWLAELGREVERLQHDVERLTASLTAEVNAHEPKENRIDPDEIGQPHLKETL